MSPSVLVLGHRGMLGHVVRRYLAEQGYSVTTLDARFEAGREMELLAEARACGAAAVINCIGVRSSAEVSDSNVLLVNGLLPQLLAAGLGGVLLVQPSSDAVFSGGNSASTVHDAPNAEDVYGLSKRLGERCVELGPAVVLRTSLVGPELGRARSLLAWLAIQKGSVRGFTDQHWNGITTLAWAKLCLRAVRGELGLGIHQPATEASVTKQELLEALAVVFGIDVQVEPAPSGKAVDRRLVPTLVLPPIREQLVELRQWYDAAIR